MTMKRRRLLVDVVGYASLIPIFVLYNHLERNHSGYVAVIVALLAFLPVAAVWHHFYGRFSENR